ncbi:resuscitation-promoting factor [Cellulomonas composti]|uniref:resuscitation-promoting factor n=1 Tax=Cellulomonas composti TaxID=266130 RepID=UPI0024823053|nr:resuscitation-promoting factor [Cellulomonas composti]
MTRRSDEDPRDRRIEDPGQTREAAPATTLSREAVVCLFPSLVPGHRDGWSPVPFSHLPRIFARASASTTPSATEPGATTSDASSGTAPERGRQGRRRLVVPAVVTATALVLVTGTAVFAQAHKKVTIDVDGEVREVSTFAGSVEGLLQDQGVPVDERDDVSPQGALNDGADIVVRHAHRLTVEQDGTEREVWTTALTAADALEVLAVRDASIALVASRSGSRAGFAIDLATAENVSVLADGHTVTVEDTARTLPDALTSADVELGPLDRVSLEAGSNGGVLVVVQRVLVRQEVTTQDIAFTTTTREDPDSYEGSKTVETAGKAGVRTIRQSITTIDGTETARIVMSDEVTSEPVDAVVLVGTKERPAVRPGPISSPGDAASLNWAALAQCESGGNPRIVSSNGLYYGLYQFSLGTWRAVGGAGLPSEASSAEQTSRAQMLYNRSGAGQWPHCGSRLFS